jgi:hypothetical protein
LAGAALLNHASDACKDTTSVLLQSRFAAPNLPIAPKMY